MQNAQPYEETFDGYIAALTLEAAVTAFGVNDGLSTEPSRYE